jgi:hypothetical protein
LFQETLFPDIKVSLKKGADGFDYIDPRMFSADFAADLPKKLAEFMASSQMPAADEVFHARIQAPSSMLNH